MTSTKSMDEEYTADFEDDKTPTKSPETVASAVRSDGRNRNQTGDRQCLPILISSAIHSDLKSTQSVVAPASTSGHCAFTASFTIVALLTVHVVAQTRNRPPRVQPAAVRTIR